MKAFFLVCVFSFLNLFQIFAQELSDCNFYRGNKSEEEHQIELQTYLNCLVENNLQSKNKSQLLEDLRGTHIVSKFTNTMMMYSKNHINYQSLLRLSSIEDLEKMLHSKVAEWRYYGFLGLAEKQETDVFSALKILLNDNTLVKARIGCLYLESTISDFCIQAVTARYIFEEEDYKSEIYQLTTEEKEELDRLLEAK